MKQELCVRRLGPIRECRLEVDTFTILTGAQASGKSTLAKAIFFFKTLKQDVFDQITHLLSDEDYPVSMVDGFEKRARNRFLRIFGSSWAMDRSMRMKYSYAPHVGVEVYLEEDRRDAYRSFVKLTIAESIREFLQQYDTGVYEWSQIEKRQELRRKIQSIFHDEYEAVYIPAGRSLTTVLSDQLAAMMDEDQRTLDYCMKSYIRLILSKRIAFREGLDGLLQEKLQTTQEKVDRHLLTLVKDRIQEVLQGKYIYERGEERLQLPGNEHRYVKINFASSGQQETIWVFNLIYYYLLERSKIFLIIEEPEAHLFPDAQKKMAEVLGIFSNAGNFVFVTTHSPYMLGAFNNLCYAGNLGEDSVTQTKLPLESVLHRQTTAVWHIKSGHLYDGFLEDFIDNSLIDGASDEINAEIDELMELRYKESGEAR